MIDRNWIKAAVVAGVLAVGGAIVGIAGAAAAPSGASGTTATQQTQTQTTPAQPPGRGMPGAHRNCPHMGRGSGSGGSGSGSAYQGPGQPGVAGSV